MSTKITLESRQRLPSKVQDVICDSALIIQHATSASGSSEMLNSCSKQFCAAEQSIGTTSTSLNKMDSLLDAMQQQCYEVENRFLRDSADPGEVKYAGGGKKKKRQEFESKQKEIRIGVVSDVLEIMQTIERNKYFTEEGLRPTCESDVDSTA